MGQLSNLSDEELIAGLEKYSPINKKDSIVPELVQDAKDYYQSFHEPTPPANSIKDFLTRVVPASAGKTAVGMAEYPYKLAKSFTDPLLTSRPLAGMGNALIENVSNVSKAIGEPIGTYGLQRLKERWLSDPVGSTMALYSYVAPMISKTGRKEIINAYNNLSDKIKMSDWYGKLPWKEKGLVALSYDELLKSGMNAADLARMNDSYFRDALNASKKIAESEPGMSAPEIHEKVRTSTEPIIQTTQYTPREKVKSILKDVIAESIDKINQQRNESVIKKPIETIKEMGIEIPKNQSNPIVSPSHELIKELKDMGYFGTLDRLRKGLITEDEAIAERDMQTKMEKPKIEVKQPVVAPETITPETPTVDTAKTAEVPRVESQEQGTIDNNVKNLSDEQLIDFVEKNKPTIVSESSKTETPTIDTSKAAETPIIKADAQRAQTAKGLPAPSKIETPAAVLPEQEVKAETPTNIKEINKQNKEKDIAIQQILNDLNLGESPQLLKKDTEQGEVYSRTKSSNPDYFVKLGQEYTGITKAYIKNILKKAQEGKLLTDKQSKILDELISTKTKEIEGQRGYLRNELPKVVVADLNLNVGDKFKILGEEFKVIEKDNEGNFVIKDGEEYIVDEFDKIPEPDKGSLKLKKPTDKEFVTVQQPTIIKEGGVEYQTGKQVDIVEKPAEPLSPKMKARYDKAKQELKNAVKNKDMIINYEMARTGVSQADAEQIHRNMLRTIASQILSATTPGGWSNFLKETPPDAFINEIIRREGGNIQGQKPETKSREIPTTTKEGGVEYQANKYKAIADEIRALPYDKRHEALSKLSMTELEAIGKEVFVSKGSTKNKDAFIRKIASGINNSVGYKGLNPEGIKETQGEFVGTEFGQGIEEYGKLSADNLSVYLKGINSQSIQKLIGEERLVKRIENPFYNIDITSGQYGGGRYLFRDKNREILSALNFTGDKQKGYILSNIYTRPDHRNQGIATKLIELAKKDMPDIKVSEFLTDEGGKFFGKTKESTAQTQGLQTVPGENLPGRQLANKWEEESLSRYKGKNILNHPQDIPIIVVGQKNEEIQTYQTTLSEKQRVFDAMKAQGLVNITWRAEMAGEIKTFTHENIQKLYKNKENQSGNKILDILSKSPEIKSKNALTK